MRNYRTFPKKWMIIFSLSSLKQLVHFQAGEVFAAIHRFVPCSGLLGLGGSRVCGRRLGKHRTKCFILSIVCDSKAQMSRFSKIERSPQLLFWQQMEGMEYGVTRDRSARPVSSTVRFNGYWRAGKQRNSPHQVCLPLMLKRLGPYRLRWPKTDSH